MVKSTIGPYFRKKELTLKELEARHIQQFYTEKLKTVTPNSVIHYHAVIYQALKYAMKTDMVPQNVAMKVDRPRKNSFQPTFLDAEQKPNLASKHLTRHYSDVLLPLGITYEYRKTAAARLVLLELHDGADGHDGSSGSERLASLRKQNDGTFRLPQASSQASSASWEEAEDDEELPL